MSSTVFTSIVNKCIEVLSSKQHMQSIHSIDVALLKQASLTSNFRIGDHVTFVRSCVTRIMSDNQDCLLVAQGDHGTVKNIGNYIHIKMSNGQLVFVNKMEQVKLATDEEIQLAISSDEALDKKASVADVNKMNRVALLQHLFGFKKYVNKNNNIANIVSAYKEMLNFKSKDYEWLNSLDKSADVVMSLQVDGELVGIHWDGKNTKCYSTDGVVRSDLKVLNEVSQLMGTAGIKEAMFFGELYCVNEDGSMMKYASSKSMLDNPNGPAEEDRINLVAFDIYLLDGTQVSYSDYWSRFSLMQKYFRHGVLAKAAATVKGRVKDAEEFWSLVQQGKAEGLIVYKDGDVIKIQSAVRQERIEKMADHEPVEVLVHPYKMEFWRDGHYEIYDFSAERQHDSMTDLPIAKGQYDNALTLSYNKMPNDELVEHLRQDLEHWAVKTQNDKNASLPQLTITDDQLQQAFIDWPFTLNWIHEGDGETAKAELDKVFNDFKALITLQSLFRQAGLEGAVSITDEVLVDQSPHYITRGILLHVERNTHPFQMLEYQFSPSDQGKGAYMKSMTSFERMKDWLLKWIPRQDKVEVLAAQEKYRVTLQGEVFYTHASSPDAAITNSIIQYFARRKQEGKKPLMYFPPSYPLGDKDIYGRNQTALVKYKLKDRGEVIVEKIDDKNAAYMPSFFSQAPSYDERMFKYPDHEMTDPTTMKYPYQKPSQDPTAPKIGEPGYADWFHERLMDNLGQIYSIRKFVDKFSFIQALSENEQAEMIDAIEDKLSTHDSDLSDQEVAQAVIMEYMANKKDKWPRTTWKGPWSNDTPWGLEPAMNTRIEGDPGLYMSDGTGDYGGHTSPLQSVHQFTSPIAPSTLPIGAAQLTKEAAPQDGSRPELERLRDEGYTTVTWRKNDTAEDVPCVDLDGKQWPINEFIEGLLHDAPIFEKSHVGCRCSLVVSGPNLDDQLVYGY